MLNYIHIRIPTNPKTKIIYSHKMFFYHNPKTAFICAEWPWAQWPLFFFTKDILTWHNRKSTCVKITQ